jgi:hypothetical protein
LARRGKGRKLAEKNEEECMYTRVARFEGGDISSEGGDISKLDELIEATHREIESGFESPPEGLEGATGAWVLVDRTRGTSLGITFFETEEELRRGDRALNEMSPPVPEATGRRTSVEVYEVAIRKER